MDKKKIKEEAAMLRNSHMINRHATRLRLITLLGEGHEKDG